MPRGSYPLQQHLHPDVGTRTKTAHALIWARQQHVNTTGAMSNIPLLHSFATSRPSSYEMPYRNSKALALVESFGIHLGPPQLRSALPFRCMRFAVPLSCPRVGQCMSWNALLVGTRLLSRESPLGCAGGSASCGSEPMLIRLLCAARFIVVVV